MDFKELENNWQYKSLANLEAQFAAIPIDSTTRLTETCTSLLRVPLNEYTTEDLRMMIGQNLGLSYLIPLAIEKIQEDIFAEGNLYPGDLLSNVFSVDAEFWKQNQNCWMKVNELIANREGEIIEAKISFEKFKNANNN